MIRDAYAMLCQEPWCMTPEQFGKLTDWQIEYLYARPAVERAEEMRRDMPTKPGAPAPAGSPLPPRRPTNSAPDFEPGTEGHRRQCVAAFMQIQGLSKARAEAQYDRQLKQWQAEQGK